MNILFSIVLIPVFVLIVSFFLGLVVDVVVPEALYTALGTVFSYLSFLNFVIPVDTIGTILLLTIGFHLSLFYFRAWLWVFRMFRPK